MSNLIYALPGTPRIFAPSGGDTTFTPTSVANAAGRVSARWDRGTGAQPSIYRWQARARANVAPTVGNVVRVYLVLGEDGTFAPGALGTADAGITTEDDLLNAQLIGNMVADAASTTRDFVAHGIVEIRSRYVQAAWWNALGQALHATGTNHEFVLTPYSDQIQNAA